MDKPFKVGDVVDYSQLANGLIQEMVGVGPFVLTDVQLDPELGWQVALCDSSGKVVSNLLGNKPRFVSAVYFQPRP